MDNKVQKLKNEMVKFIEILLSKKHLAPCAFLVRNLDENNFLDINALLRIPMVRFISIDRILWASILRESSELELSKDGTKIRPAHLKYHVMVLCNISECTTITQIQNLFRSENCPQFAKCRKVDRTKWKLYYETIPDVLAAHRYLVQRVQVPFGPNLRAMVHFKTRLPSPDSYKLTSSQRYQIGYQVFEIDAKHDSRYDELHSTYSNILSILKFSDLREFLLKHSNLQD